MYYAYKYRLKPSEAHRKELDRHRDICRQLYNHALYRFDQIPDDLQRPLRDFGRFQVTALTSNTVLTRETARQQINNQQQQRNLHNHQTTQRPN
jgi:hypothetical protein